MDELGDVHAARARQEAREPGDQHGARVHLHGAHAQHHRCRQHQLAVGTQHCRVQPVGALQHVVATHGLTKMASLSTSTTAATLLSTSNPTRR